MQLSFLTKLSWFALLVAVFALGLALGHILSRRFEENAVINFSTESKTTLSEKLKLENNPFLRATLRYNQTVDVPFPAEERERIFAYIEEVLSKSVYIKSLGIEGRKRAYDIGIVLSQKNNLSANQVRRLIELAIEDKTEMSITSDGLLIIADRPPVIIDGYSAKSLFDLRASEKDELDFKALIPLK
jgi:hypothetical protein